MLYNVNTQATTTPVRLQFFRKNIWSQSPLKIFFQRSELILSIAENRDRAADRVDLGKTEDREKKPLRIRTGALNRLGKAVRHSYDALMGCSDMGVMQGHGRVTAEWVLGEILPLSNSCQIFLFLRERLNWTVRATPRSKCMLRPNPANQFIS